MLTRKQFELLRFINERLKDTGYPPPMVDLAESRERALAAYQDLPKAGD